MLAVPPAGFGEWRPPLGWVTPEREAATVPLQSSLFDIGFISILCFSRVVTLLLKTEATLVMFYGNKEAGEPCSEKKNRL